MPEISDADARRIWERDAPRYDRWMRYVDRYLILDGRRWVCAQATGRVLEVAVGTGLNLPHYPTNTNLTGVDLSPAMLDRARHRAHDSGIAVDLTETSASALPFSDDSFDTVVCVLALARFPTTGPHSPRCTGYCARQAGCCSSTTS